MTYQFRGRPGSQAARMCEYIFEHGEATSAELAVSVGIPRHNVAATLLPVVKRGDIARFRDLRPGANGYIWCRPGDPRADQWAPAVTSPREAEAAADQDIASEPADADAGTEAVDRSGFDIALFASGEISITWTHLEGVSLTREEACTLTSFLMRAQAAVLLPAPVFPGARP